MMKNKKRLTMQTKKFLAISLIILSVLGGCKKNTKQSTNKKSSLFSKSNKSKHRSSSDSVDPLNLDANSMRSFALDDKISKHTTPQSTSNQDNPMFSWENVDAEKSR